MKILRINKYYYVKGGSERHLFESKKLLEKFGHTVISFSMKDKRNEPTCYDKYFIKNIDYSKFNLLNILKIFYNWEAVRKLKKLIKEEKPNIAHLQNIYHQISPAVIKVLRKHNIPMVMTLHDYKLVCPNYRLFNRGRICQRCQGGRFYQCLFGRCMGGSFFRSFIAMAEAYLHQKTYQQVDLFISPSLFLKKTFENFGLKGKIIHLPHFFARQNIKPKLPKNLPDNYLLYVGRLSEEKGIDTAIKALRIFHNQNRNSNLSLVIAGEGPLEKELKDLVKRLKLEDRIYFIGRQSVEYVHGLIKRSTAVVVPSICWENFPNTVIEASMLTKIIICANMGGMPEMVKDGQTGFLFKAGEAQNLADIIAKVIKMPPQKLVAMARNAYRAACLRHDYKRYYQTLIGYYRDLIKNK